MSFGPGYVVSTLPLLNKYPGAEVALSLRKLRSDFGSEGAAGPDLSLTNNGVTQGSGIVGNAGVFDGASELTISGTESTRVDTAITIEVWVQLNSKSTGDNQILVRDFNDSTSVGWNLFYDNNSDDFGFNFTDGAGSFVVVNGTTSPSINTWYHVVTHWDGSDLRLFVNGSQEGSVSANSTSNDTGTVFGIGSQDGGREYLNGKIAPVRFWNGRALTSTEISTLYNNGSGLSLSTIKTDEPQLLDDLVAAYEFEDNNNLGKDSFVLDGPVVRVRRGADDVERDIGFDGDGVVDEQELLDFANGGDVFVVTWYDQSGNAHDPSQGTLADQPQIVSSGAISTNGDGIKCVDFAATSGWLKVASGFADLAEPVSVFVIVDRNGNTDYERIVSWATATDNDNDNYIPILGNGDAGTIDIGSLDTGMIAVPSNPGGMVQFSNHIDAAKQVLNRLNTDSVAREATATSQNGPSDRTLDRLGIGNNPGSISNSFKGFAREFIIYPDDMKADGPAIEQEQLDSY